MLQIITPCRLSNFIFSHAQPYKHLLGSIENRYYQNSVGVQRVSAITSVIGENSLKSESLSINSGCGEIYEPHRRIASRQIWQNAGHVFEPISCNWGTNVDQVQWIDLQTSGPEPDNKVTDCELWLCPEWVFTRRALWLALSLASTE
jgi:hypothetical protein